jgi:hypothetical protein
MKFSLSMEIFIKIKRRFDINDKIIKTNYWQTSKGQ